MKNIGPLRHFFAPTNRRQTTLRSAITFTVFVALVAAGLVFTRITTAQKKPGTVRVPPTPTERVFKTYLPTEQPLMVFPSIKLSDIARQEALEPARPGPAEIRAIHPPKDGPGNRPGVAISRELTENAERSAQAPVASPTGPSPIPTKTFQGEFLSGTTIPPDTMGAVGTTHIVTVSNNMMRIQNRDGVQVSRQTLSSFWSGVALEGGAAVSAFDPKIYFDRFNSRWIFIASANAQSLSSAALIGVSATADPTGTWFRYGIDGDGAATAAGGKWIDYPTVGFNKNWIVVNENVFNYGTSGTGYFGPTIYAIDKAAIYAGPGALSANLFSADFNATCVSPFEGQLGCGFTMAPAVTEDNTTDTVYLVEDWDSTLAQLRLSKITGTPSTPVLTVGTQFPQSPNSWRFNATRIGTTGGYTPQRQQSLHATSGTRIMSNDSRIQNSVFRNGALWTAHTVMLSTTPQSAGTTVGTLAIPDNHSGVQWWQINPTIETGLSTVPLQLGRIEDPTATNCHNGTGGILATPPCNSSTLNQVGQFYLFPNISVNQNDDVLIGLSMHSNLSYPSSGYAIRRSSDPPNTFRDPVMFRPGQANYNIGAGSGAARQNRWGDYSAAQTDPLNDTDFWTIQEYAGTVRDFGIGLAGNWETWWALVKPTNAIPSTSGNLIISEFRLRGPQGVRDEFVELYNPSSSPLIVNTTDNSDGWALAFSTNGTTIVGVAVIPNGTVIPGKGHFLIADNPDGATGPTLVYGLGTYPGATNPSTAVRGADSDTGWSLDLADNGGLAIFKTSNTANFSAATRMDSVGFSGITAGLFREGAGLPPITASTPTGQMSYVRNEATGVPSDTNANENDFVLVNPINELSPTPVQGAAAPQNLSAPIVTSAIPATLVAPCAAASAAPNRVRTGSGNSGTLEIRRTFTNNTGAPVSRLRFRIVDLTTAPAPNPTTAILAVVNSVASTPATCPSGTVSLLGLTLEEPPNQTVNGGGINSSLDAGIISLSSPLANGASINVNFMTNILQAGQFRFFINVEALQ